MDFLIIMEKHQTALKACATHSTQLESYEGVVDPMRRSFCVQLVAGLERAAVRVSAFRAALSVTRVLRHV
jgi:hypothetical protein